MEQNANFEERRKAVLSCDLPLDLHPVASNSLDAFLEGRLPIEEFARYFSIANSAYISVTDCILAHLEPVTATAALF